MVLHEARVVRRIFEAVVREHKALRAVAIMLNEESVPIRLAIYDRDRSQIVLGEHQTTGLLIGVGEQCAHLLSRWRVEEREQRRAVLLASFLDHVGDIVGFEHPTASDQSRPGENSLETCRSELATELRSPASGAGM